MDQDDAWIATSKPNRARTYSRDSVGSGRPPKRPVRGAPSRSNSTRGGRGRGGRGAPMRSQSYHPQPSKPGTPNKRAVRRNKSNDSLGNRHSNHSLNGSSHHIRRSGSKRSLNNSQHSSTRGEVELFNSTGMGNSAADRRVVRHAQDALLARRSQFLECNQCIAHERCRWRESDRIEFITEQMKTLFNFVPITVNEETRWKAKVMKEDGVDDSDDEDELTSRALAILNKLSWTTLDKLTAQFLETISGDEDTEAEIVRNTMALVLEKAMLEPHFAEMYASFCTKLSASNPSFRKTLLTLCQTKFDETEIEKENTLLMKKKSIGLMKFIGELYKSKHIKGRIMVGCLRRLLKPDDEEKLECFTQLMTTVGGRLHSADAPKDAKDELDILWQSVYPMAGKLHPDANDVTAPSSRLKFLLQDLIELKENNWVSQRNNTPEKAKTIDQIHEEVRKEQSNGFYRGVPRSHSANSLRTGGPGARNGLSRSAHGPQFRKDKPSVSNLNHLSRSFHEKKRNSSPNKRPVVPGLPRSPPKRTQSDSLAAMAKGTRSRSPSSEHAKTQAAPTQPAPALVKTKEQVDPSQCAMKTKSLLKEYFVGGDFKEATRSLEEIIGVGSDGDVARGSAVVEASVLLVLEMKDAEVKKLDGVILYLVSERRLHGEALKKGLKEPLEFISDIQIDAPRAGELFCVLLSSWLNKSSDVNDPFSVYALFADHSRLPSNADEILAHTLAKISSDTTKEDVAAIDNVQRRLLPPPTKLRDEDGIKELIERYRNRIE